MRRMMANPTAGEPGTVAPAPVSLVPDASDRARHEPAEPSVFIVEDHPLIREGLQAAFERAGIRVAGETASVVDAYDLIVAARPDVVINDVRLGDGSGIELTRRLLRRDSRLGVVIYTGTQDPVALRDVLDCGARGFVYKTAGRRRSSTPCAPSRAAGPTRAAMPWS